MLWATLKLVVWNDVCSEFPASLAAMALLQKTRSFRLVTSLLSRSGQYFSTSACHRQTTNIEAVEVAPESLFTEEHAALRKSLNKVNI